MNVKKLKYGKVVYYRKHPRVWELSPLKIEGFHTSGDNRTVYAYGKDEDGYYTGYHDIRELVTSKLAYWLNCFWWGKW